MNMQLFNNNNKYLQNMPFNKQFFYRIAKTAPIIVEQQKIEQNNNNDNNDQTENSRVRWGPSIWFLFHTLAHKIKNEDCPRLKVDFLDIVRGICAIYDIDKRS